MATAGVAATADSADTAGTVDSADTAGTVDKADTAAAAMVDTATDGTVAAGAVAAGAGNNLWCHQSTRNCPANLKVNVNVQSATKDYSNQLALEHRFEVYLNTHLYPHLSTNYSC